MKSLFKHWETKKPFSVLCVLSGQNEHNCWKPTVCMNFCCDFLSFVKQIAIEDHPRSVAVRDDAVQPFFFWSKRLILNPYCPSSVVYLFSSEPCRDVTFSVHRDSQYSFLPHWFVEEMSSRPDAHHQPWLTTKNGPFLMSLHTSDGGIWFHYEF